MSSAALNIDRVKSIQNQINEKLLKRLNKSLIFIDSLFSEWFHLTCGLETLIKTGGGINIKEFSSFQNGGDSLKAVFFISKLLDDSRVNIQILRDIIKSSKFQYVIIVLNETLEEDESNSDFLDQLRDDVLMWMGNANYTFEIFIEKIPFLCLPSSQNKTTGNQISILNFLNPLSSFKNTSYYHLVNFDTYLTLVKQDIHDLTQQTQSTGSHYSSLLSSTSQSSKDQITNYYQVISQSSINEIQNLAYSLHLMLDYLDAKDDCYSLGVLSKLVSHELNSMQMTKQRRKNAQNKVSLLLIDRNLDLTMPSLYHDETVFDKMNNILDNLNETSNDVKFNLYDFLFSNKYKSVPNATFFHTTDDICEYLIEQILLTKPKECLLEIYRKLNEVFPGSSQQQTDSSAAQTKKNLSNRISRITVDTIKTQLKNQIKTKPDSLYEHLNFIQIIVSYCLACDNQLKEEVKFDSLISYIKVLTQKLTDKDDASILSQLYQMFHDDFEKPFENRKFKLVDLLTILCYIYSLIGEECFYGIEEENRMKKLILSEVKELLGKQDEIESEFIQKFVLHEKSSEQFVEKYFERLKGLKLIRSNYKQFNKILLRSQDHEKPVYKPLVKQICEYLLNSANDPSEQLVDIELRTTTEGIKDLFKLKLGSYLGGSQQRNHPLNNEYLIIYIVGGITTYEMKLVREIFSKTEYKILIGSSHIYNHKKLIKYLST